MVNVRRVERDQLLLMPPSLSDWLPADHLAWFVVDVVAELDMLGFYESLRADGRGGASYDPEVVLGILLYSYCVGERSSRRIEHRLTDDVAFRVVAANQVPDHATLARFRRRHQDAIAGVFVQVVALCMAEGLVQAGVVAIDGTKIEADVSVGSSVTRRQIIDEILEEAEAVDAAEDAELGDRRGDELPEKWADRRNRRARLREALRQLDADGPSDAESYQAARTARGAEMGHKLGGRRACPDSRWASPARTRRINVTDPDSRTLKDRRRFIWGYNAQAAVTEDQIVVAAEVTTAARDSVVFEAMVATTQETLADTGADQVETFVADTGYWSIPNATLDIDADVLITPMPLTGGITDPDDPRLTQRREVIERLDAGNVTVTAAAAEMGVSTTTARKLLRDHRAGRPDPIEVRQAMVQRLATDKGAAIYAKRKTTVETVLGTSKPTSDSGDSQGEDSMPRQASGDSSAPSTTCSKSTDTEPQLPEPGTSIDAPPPEHAETPTPETIYATAPSARVLLVGVLRAAVTSFRLLVDGRVDAFRELMADETVHVLVATGSSQRTGPRPHLRNGTTALLEGDATTI